jgi:DNA-binding transcriptional MocR family regulator
MIDDRELTLTAVRLAGLVLASYEIGVGNPVKLSLRKTADELGVKKDTLIHARDQLVERGWLIRLNDGSSRTAAYDLGPGPRVRATGPSKVRATGPHSNKTSTSLSESENPQTQRRFTSDSQFTQESEESSDREDKNRADRKLPLMRVVRGGRR